jgi:cytochrome c
LASFLPDHARNNHGNLAEQQRGFGAQVGADTTRPAGAPRVVPVAAAAAAAAAAPSATNPAAAQALALARQHNCLACHGVDNKIVGPGLTEVARKYAGRADAVAYLEQRIKAGGTGVWGAIPMPEQALPATDARLIAQWLAQGAAKP